jgi:hypothetical protein
MSKRCCGAPKCPVAASRPVPRLAVGCHRLSLQPRNKSAASIGSLVGYDNEWSGRVNGAGLCVDR